MVKGQELAVFAISAEAHCKDVSGYSRMEIDQLPQVSGEFGRAGPPI